MKNSIITTRRLSIKEALYYLATILSLAAVPVRAANVDVEPLFQAIEKIRYADLLNDYGYTSSAETRLRTAGYQVRTTASQVRRVPNSLEEAALLDRVVSVLVLPPGTEAVRRRVFLSLDTLGAAIPLIAGHNPNHLSHSEKRDAAAVDVRIARILLYEGLLDRSTDAIGEGIAILRSVPGLGITRAREALTDALIAALDERLSSSRRFHLVLASLDEAERALERTTLEE